MFLMNRWGPRVAACLAIGLTISVSGLATAQTTERNEQQFAVAGRPEITISNFAGPVEVKAWNRPDVLVTTEKEADNASELATIQIRVEQNGSRIVVDTQYQGAGRSREGRSAQVRISVSVPVGSDVRADTKAGPLTVEGVSGTVDLRTGAGPLRAVGAFNAARARSGAGPVTVRAERGSTTAGAWEISTGAGPVTLEVPDNFSGDLEADSGVGNVQVQGIALSNLRANRQSEVRGQLGSGGNAVRVHSGAGPVSLRKS